MLKFQEINWVQYQVDIEDTMTVSALSMRIFRCHYLDDENYHLPIPNRNEDTFTRRGYYGGHVDVYKPGGKNVYVYDVNSLYPFVMDSFPMPCGIPVWRNNLENVELDSLCGFIEASVVCPDDMDRPFLPYKDPKYETLLFPTGKWKGVYYSEELKYARTLGYTITPFRGYLFETKDSLFSDFVKDCYARRSKAKKRGDTAMSYVYKMVMNSLYGRFGISPESLLTLICTADETDKMIYKPNFQSSDQLTDDKFLVNLVVNSKEVSDDEWQAPKMSAVYISAAITACARIHMYPFISDPACIYTDTDSLIRTSPLPEIYISSTELGKFKLEQFFKEVKLVAPKTWMGETKDGKYMIRFKGAGKDLVTSDWFNQISKDPGFVQEYDISSPFRVDWQQL